MGSLLSAGHGTAGCDALTDLFRAAAIGRVVDIRRFPGSRRNPDVASDAMATWLPAAGIAYRWEPRLGGRRRLDHDQDPDTDRWWRVEAFRAYAGHMRTDDFRTAMAELIDDVRAPEGPATLVLCSESLWWRCHRRLVSDAAMLLHGVDVQHLGHDGRLSPHHPSDGARVTDHGLVYDRDPDGS